MTFKLGLTGSIGMGKTTTAQMFAELGCAVWDADAAVHRLYGPGGSAVEPIGLTFPQAVVNGTVSRVMLKSIISYDTSALTRIEAIVHPLVAQDRIEFIRASDADIIVFDIPLLFETDGHRSMDAVAVVSVDPEIQEKRVLDRGTMTYDQFVQIREKQIPDAEKCARANFVIQTGMLDNVRRQVAEIISEVKVMIKNA
ncbi:MAG: dephospho-CoA kinase [Rhodobacteraceae bacterium]|nr:dephospho-CoA kinase [Paracoccaceae bacterium]